jgi:glutamyl-tRNA reductase
LNFKSRCCCGSYGAQNPTIDKDSEFEKTNVDIDLSIPKNVNENVEEIEGVTLIHMDYLSN